MAEQIIIDVTLSTQDYQKRAEEVAKSIAEIKKQQAELKKSGEQNSIVYAQNAEELKTLNAELKQNTILSQNADDSILGMRASLSLLTAQWVRLSQEQRENSDEGKNLSARMRELSDKLKEQESQVGNTSRNVGNYKEAILEALKSNIPFASTISETASKASSLSGAFDLGTGAAGKFRIALISIPLIAIATAILALITYFSKFEKGIDFIEQKTAFLSGAFDALIGIIGRLGETLIDALTHPAELIKSIGDFLDDPIQGFKDLGKAASDAAEEMIKTAQAAEAIKKAEQDLEDVQIDNIKVTAELEAQRDRLLIQSRDRTKSEKERISLSNQALQADKELLAVREKQAIAERDIAKARVDNTPKGIDNPDERRKLAEAEANLIKVRSESDKFEEKRINDRNKILEKQQQDQEKANEKALQLQEDYNKKKEAADKEAESSIIRTSQLQQTARQIEITNLQKSFDDRIKLYEGFNATVIQLQEERNKQLAALNDRFAKEDRDNLVKQLQALEDITISLIKDTDAKRQAELSVSQERRAQALDDQINETAARIGRGESQLNDQLRVLQDQRLAQQQQFAQENKDLQDQIAAEDLARANEVALQKAQADVLNADTVAERINAEQALADEQYRIAIENANRIGEDTTLLAAQYADQQREIEQKKNDAALNSFNSFSNQFQAAAGKNSTAAKLAADIQMRANAAVAIQNNAIIVQENIKAIAKAGSLGFPQNIIAIFATLAALSSGIAAARNLFKPVDSFADGVIGFNSDGRGSMVYGPGTGRSDSINARLSNGESVINAKSTRMFAPLLSAINVAGGGRSLKSGGGLFADGGIFDGGNTSKFATGSVDNQNEISNLVAEAVKNVKIITVVQDINEAQASASATSNRVQV